MDIRFLVEFRILPGNLFKDSLFYVKSLLPLRGKGIKSVYDFAARKFDTLEAHTH